MYRDNLGRTYTDDELNKLDTWVIEDLEIHLVTNNKDNVV